MNNSINYQYLTSNIFFSKTNLKQFKPKPVISRALVIRQ